MVATIAAAAAEAAAEVLVIVVAATQPALLLAAHLRAHHSAPQVPAARQQRCRYTHRDQWSQSGCAGLRTPGRGSSGCVNCSARTGSRYKVGAHTYQVAQPRYTATCLQSKLPTLPISHHYAPFAHQPHQHSKSARFAHHIRACLELQAGHAVPVKHFVPVDDLRAWHDFNRQRDEKVLIVR
jgi:hypothetical protein